MTMNKTIKQKYRYNNKTKKWDEVFTINTDIHVISAVRRPDGTLNSFIIPRISKVCR